MEVRNVISEAELWSGRSTGFGGRDGGKATLCSSLSSGTYYLQA